MHTAFTANTGRSKGQRITWNSISGFIEVYRWFRFYSLTSMVNLKDNMTVQYENLITTIVIRASFHVSAYFCKSWILLFYYLFKEQ